MSDETPFVFQVEPSIEDGLWCDEHALPHRVRVTALVMSKDGLSPIAHQDFCDGEEGQ